jgi:hypothetical protein
VIKGNALGGTIAYLMGFVSADTAILPNPINHDEYLLTPFTC